VRRKSTDNRQLATGNVVVGVISDTHGRMHPDAMDALRGSDIILHAGDIGRGEIIAMLGQIAPVHAIVGNIDIEPLTSKFPATDVVEIGGHSFYMLHNLRALDLDPKAAGFAAVISGHSHKPEFYFEKGVLYFNPGSAGPRRFSLPIAVGKIRIEGGELWPEIVILAE
jgi:putative phosphoesterase